MWIWHSQINTKCSGNQVARPPEVVVFHHQKLWSMVVHFRWWSTLASKNGGFGKPNPKPKNEGWTSRLFISPELRPYFCRGDTLVDQSWLLDFFFHEDNQHPSLGFWSHPHLTEFRMTLDALLSILTGLEAEYRSVILHSHIKGLIGISY